MSIEYLTVEFRVQAMRTAKLRDDVGPAIDDATAMRRLLEQNPIAAWTGGRGTDGTRYFAYEGGVFRCTFTVAPELRGSFSEMVREIVERRLGT